MSDLKPGMSVQEKLMLGLRTGLQRRDEWRAKVEQDPARLRHESRNDIMALGGIDMTDRALALPKSLRQKEVINAAEDEKRRLGFTSTETTLPDKSPGHANEWWDMYNAYIRARSMFVKGASRRLTAVSRPYNKTVHSIPGVIARRRADQIMNIEWQPSYHGMSMNKSFSAFQARSMELNGYRKRSIQYVHFQRDNNGQKSFPRGPLGANAGDDDDDSSFTTERFFEHDRKHKISLIDLDITDINGVKRRWVCIEITKPLAQVNGPAPIELTPMPQSFIKIAIPSDSILVVVDPSKSLPIIEEQPDKMEPPQLGDFDKLTIGRIDPGLKDVKMRLKISGDGVPIFVTGSKKGHMPDYSTLDDFLCASDVPGLPWKETDRRVSKNTLLLRKDEFWDRFNLAADADKVRWESLQDAMASDECIVDITFEDTGAGERQTGRKAQMSNIAAAKTVADIIRSCLGPKAMLKMLLDPMGGIVLTNDGHAILREIEVSHPAAKSMIELSRTQDEEVGDGTTTVIILAGEMLAQSLPQLERNIHPVQIIAAFRRALKDALEIVDDISLPIDVNDDKAMRGLISSSIGTKFVSRWSDLMCDLALRAVRTVTWEAGNGKTEVDIKRYARVEKVPGGEIEDSRVLDGVMLNKDITHPKMRRRIENPRIVLLDCPLEYKKGESQTNIEISKEEDWNRILQIEEEQVKAMCEGIIALKPDLVITEKGVSDLAQHYFMKANITALRRVRKTDNNRIARATGATIVNRVDDIQDSDVGTLCGLFEIEKIGDEYFTFLTGCKNPKACTVLLRGPSKDVLNEIERNLQDAMGVARNVMFNPRLSPGGGATEMAVSVRLSQLAKGVEGVQQWPYKAVADTLEVIPRTLVQNAGASPVRVLTDLRAKHAEGKHSWGINGDSGVVADMKEYGVWEPEAIKLQSIKTAIESACLLLRVDDICSARKAAQMGNGLHGGGDE
ncbi:T-complex protein 1 subunit gamma [Colletotrichum scovillei]|nr:T-complex protein 1 subunit gamma [Colletotrichum scovillei]KAG7067729.1 T-complex protein 1 subunit gamma [Colletotrichum scovillei]